MNNLKGQNTVTGAWDPAKGIAVAEFLMPHGEAAPQRTTNVAEIVNGKIRSMEFGANGAFHSAQAILTNRRG